MSEQPATGAAPEWDLADRMRKALRVAGIGVQEMADYLGVARNTVSTWINGRIEPSTQTVRLWALRTGVSYEWLCDSGNGSGPGFRSSEGLNTQVIRAIPALYPAPVVFELRRAA